MMNAKDGSYLTKRLSEKLRSNYKDKHLGEICEELQHELYEDKKQLMVNVFNNRTQYIKFKMRDDMDIKHKEKDQDDVGINTITSITSSIPLTTMISEEKKMSCINCI